MEYPASAKDFEMARPIPEPAPEIKIIFFIMDYCLNFITIRISIIALMVSQMLVIHFAM
jgi:hypothetical protein